MEDVTACLSFVRLLWQLCCRGITGPWARRTFHWCDVLCSSTVVIKRISRGSERRYVTAKVSCQKNFRSVLAWSMFVTNRCAVHSDTHVTYDRTTSRTAIRAALVQTAAVYDAGHGCVVHLFHTWCGHHFSSFNMPFVRLRCRDNSYHTKGSVVLELSGMRSSDFYDGVLQGRYEFGRVVHSTLVRDTGHQCSSPETAIFFLV
jgi:hypothetical protein